MAPSAEVNVKVIVRVRPLSEAERRDAHPVVTTRVDAREVCVSSQTIPRKESPVFNRVFQFDGVCNQYTAQKQLFTQYVVPIIDEVLQGFNCTIFAYGQTGTGKTYTMEGDLGGGNSSSSTPNTPLPLSDQAGIIPRSVHYIFEGLDAQSIEYSVRVSYLEIYNEELHDLLNDSSTALRLYEDISRGGGLSVDKLEELPVNNPLDIMNILCMACKRRRTAETLLNQQSSRSHSIFTILIHMKEQAIDGDDIIKVGKLNLVDLAGSENIIRSGAIKDRAKEAGMINQSLLTLGRVINALVERSSYIPYRDSKLTRLLQDSLGGKTKTCIVATISPSSLCLEETLSTLDYAFRAKHIRNRPEVNQRMTKRMVMRELTSEIEKLKLELQTTREKNGVYIPYQRFVEMETKLQQQDNDVSEATEEITRLKTAALEDEKEKTNLRMQLRTAKSELETITGRLTMVEEQLAESQQAVYSLNDQLKDARVVNLAMRQHAENLRRQSLTLAALLQSTCGKLATSVDQITNMRADMQMSSERSLAAINNLKHGSAEMLKQIDATQGMWAKAKDILANDVIKQAQANCFATETAMKERQTALQMTTNDHFNRLAEHLDSISAAGKQAATAAAEAFEEFIAELVSSEEKLKSEVAQLLEGVSTAVADAKSSCTKMTALVSEGITATCDQVGQVIIAGKTAVKTAASAADAVTQVHTETIESTEHQVQAMVDEQLSLMRLSTETLQKQVAAMMNNALEQQRKALEDAKAAVFARTQTSKQKVADSKNVIVSNLDKAFEELEQGEFYVRRHSVSFPIRVGEICDNIGSEIHNSIKEKALKQGHLLMETFTQRSVVTDQMRNAGSSAMSTVTKAVSHEIQGASAAATQFSVELRDGMNELGFEASRSVATAVTEVCQRAESLLELDLATTMDGVTAAVGLQVQKQTEIGHLQADLLTKSQQSGEEETVIPQMPQIDADPLPDDDTILNRKSITEEEYVQSEAEESSPPPSVAEAPPVVQSQIPRVTTSRLGSTTRATPSVASSSASRKNSAERRLPSLVRAVKTTKFRTPGSPNASSEPRHNSDEEIASGLEFENSDPLKRQRSYGKLFAPKKRPASGPGGPPKGRF